MATYNGANWIFGMYPNGNWMCVNVPVSFVDWELVQDERTSAIPSMIKKNLRNMNLSFDYGVRKLASEIRQQAS